MNLTALENSAISSFLGENEYEEIKEERFKSFSYPKVFKLMKFETKRFKAAGFGHIFSMRT